MIIPSTNIIPDKYCGVVKPNRSIGLSLRNSTKKRRKLYIAINAQKRVPFLFCLCFINNNELNITRFFIDSINWDGILQKSGGLFKY